MKILAICSIALPALFAVLPASAQIVSEPFCFMRMGDRIVDLTSMCAASDVDADEAIATIAPATSIDPAPVVLPAPVARGEVRILNWRYDADGYIVGSLRNNTAAQIQFAQIGYEVYDGGNSLVDSGSFYADRQSIEVGGTSAFSYPVRIEGDRVVLTEVTWR